MKLESAENLHIVKPACHQFMIKYSVKNAIDIDMNAIGFSDEIFSLSLSLSLEGIIAHLWNKLCL